MSKLMIFISLWSLVNVSALASNSAQLPYDCELKKQESQLYCAKPGWYVHGALGMVQGSTSIADISDPLVAQGFDVSDVVINDKRSGLKFNLGYSFTEHLALEAGYSDLGEVDVTMSALVADSNAFYRAVETLHPTSAKGGTISGVATIPLTSTLTLNGRIGIFQWQGNYKTENLGGSANVGSNEIKGRDIYYGLYGEYLLSKQTRLALEWERYHFDQDNSDMFSVGLKYYFGTVIARQAKPAVSIVKPVKLIESAPLVIATSKELRLTVPFANDKSIISDDFLAQLHAIGKKLAGHSIEKFTIAGHTSKVGSRRYNQKLSERRVNATVSYFIKTFSIKPSVIKTSAHGEDRLLDNSTTPAAADANRRIELYIRYLEK